MKLLTAVILVALSAPALADDAARAGACYTISDPDTRAYCRAKAHRESSACYSIQKPDVKAQCLAETRK